MRRAREPVKRAAHRGHVARHLGRRYGPLPSRTVAPRAPGDIRSLVTAIYSILQTILHFYIYAVIAAAILSTLVSFGVVDSRNRFVWAVGDFLYRITEPALRPIRNLLPNMGGLDLSPWVLILLLGATQNYLLPKIYAAIEFGDYRGLLL